MLFYLLSILSTHDEHRVDYVATVHDQGTTKCTSQDLVNLREAILSDLKHMKWELKDFTSKSFDEVRENFKTVETNLAEIKGLIRKLEEAINMRPLLRENGVRNKDDEFLTKRFSNDNRSVNPYPGTTNDYNFLIEVISRLRKCDECCTCLNDDICLATVYSELLTLLGKYPDWKPSNNILKPSNSTPNESNLGTVLELVIRFLKKERCNKCAICASINKHPKLSYLFGPSINDLFFTGDINDDHLKRMLLGINSGLGGFSSMGNEGLGGLDRIMPSLLLSFLNKDKKKDCNELPCESARQEYGRRSRECPETRARRFEAEARTRECPETRVRRLETERAEQPAYGRRHSVERKDNKPAYGKNYGSF